MKAAITRLAVLVILLANQTLTMAGYNPLPFSEQDTYEGVTSVLTVVMAVYTWYKNNNVTKHAQQAQEHLDNLKGGAK